jgi:iron complex outermembrane receptor protein
VKVTAYRDEHLEAYLRQQGYDEEEIARYAWRALAARRRYGDFSASAGASWDAGEALSFTANAGRSFRLPGANELAANGVHHGTFRHEQGDPALLPERGWQLDLSCRGAWRRLSLAISPFAALFDNYIYLRPTGEWSALPHAGQIYRYTGARVLFAGAEVSLGIELPRGFSYRFTGEHVHARNRDERCPLSFTPPAAARNTIAWSGAGTRWHVEWLYTAAQRRVARNEDTTPAASLLHAGVTTSVPLGSTRAEITLSLQNLTGARYFNHLSFYRKIEIPEPGRDVRLVIKVPFKHSIK